MTRPTDIPAWAWEKASEVACVGTRDQDAAVIILQTMYIARALVSERERAARIAEKYRGPGGGFSAEEADKTVFGWGRARSSIAAAIRRENTNAE